MLTQTLTKISGLNTKQRVVKRTYKTKKGVKSKEYTYGSSELLFRKTKKGYKLIDKSWKKFEESIVKSASSKTEAMSLLNEARRIRNDILNDKTVGLYGSTSSQYKSIGQKGWNRIDTKSLISRLAMDSASKYLLNMGINPEELISYVKQETGKEITLSELLNDGNWIQDTWNGVTADGSRVTLVVKFSYNGLNNIVIQ